MKLRCLQPDQRRLVYCCCSLTNCFRVGGCAGVNYSFLTSKERDIETGLDYFLARYYASTQGRFTSTDPITMTEDRLYDPQQINLFAYCRNNPLAFTDPIGETISFRNGDPDSQKAFDEYEKFINKDPKKYAKEIATLKQLRSSDVNYIVILGGRQKSETAEGNTGPDEKGDNILVRIRNIGGASGETLDRNGRFAHELEHARQFDSGELAYRRDTKTGEWSADRLSYDVMDEVNAFNAYLRVAPQIKDSVLMRRLRDTRISDSDRARDLIRFAYPNLENRGMNNNVRVGGAMGYKPGDLIRPNQAPRNFFGRVHTVTK